MPSTQARLPQPDPLRQALALIQHLEKQLAQSRRAADNPIAVVGMGCRFPGGANSPEAYWKLLAAGIDAVRPIPRERWDVDALYDSDQDAPGKIYTTAGGFLEDLSGFDAAFFELSPREARSLDPQQRLLLEVTWEALEHAAISPASLRQTPTGVFVGIGQNDYARLQFNAGDLSRISRFDGTGNGFCFAPGRLSHFLGLRGPSMAVDTACSSSLVAVHLACQSLQSHECDMAVAAGVQLILSPEVTTFLCRAGALAPDGRCKTFDASANGFGRGEGGGAIVLKRLADAEADGDAIWAVIRGSATNHDGPSSGLTVPSPKAQALLLQAALRASGLVPEDIGLIEAHGTGTPMGDPIEVQALASVFGKRLNPMWLGSAKTNHGHLEAAAGIAGLIKTVLCLHHGQVPPHLHFQELNPAIPPESFHFQIARTLEPWHSETVRRAGVSSFGFGGTNAHVVLEAAPPQKPGHSSAETRTPGLLLLSAKTQTALQSLAGRLADHWQQNPALSVLSVCQTAAWGRSHFKHRLALIVTSTTDACQKLREAQGGLIPSPLPADATFPSPKQLSQRATAYLRGEEPDLPSWFPRYGPPVPLPTYPFERERFWVDPAPARPVDSHAHSPALSASDPRKSLALCETRWEPVSISPQPHAVPAVKEWLIVGNPNGVGQSIAAALTVRGQTCRFLDASALLLPSVPPPADSGTAPDCTELKAQLVTILSGSKHSFGGIIHCWNTDQATLDQAHSEPSYLAGTLTALALFQTLHSLAGASKARVWLITQQTFAVLAHEKSEPDNSLVAGLGRSLSLEWPELWGGLHDLAKAPSPKEIENLVGELLNPHLDQAAWRDSNFWIPRLRPATPLPSTSRVHFSQASAVWITGGWGSLGRRVAARLAKRGLSLLILTGRSEPSQQTQRWADQLAASGVQVWLRRSDVADPASIKSVLSEIQASPFHLSGIVHTAGVGGFAPADSLTPTAVAEVVRGKCVGAWNLHKATLGLPLDLMVFFSSIASVWGGKGQAHYSAANHFLDTLAQHRSAQGLRSLSLNWGPWLDGGMAGPEGLQKLESLGVRGIEPELALDTLEALWSGKISSQIVAANVDWPIFSELFSNLPRHSFFDTVAFPKHQTLGGLSGENTHAAIHNLGGSAPRDGSLKEWFLELLSAELESPKHRLDSDTALMHLGVDSRMALELRNRLRQAWGLEVALSELLGDLSLNALVQKLTFSPATPEAHHIPSPTAAGPQIFSGEI
jgi:acyl transferase domain-containing protein